MSIKTMSRSALHEQALTYAEAGMRVFPCWPGTKIPALDNGFHGASDDPGQIERWWNENPEYNIGCSPGHMGWSVVDLDVPKPAEIEAGVQSGADAWASVAPPLETFTVSTPNGGTHLWFDGQLKTTARRLFPGAAIDTRGDGGYVLLPPSIVEGRSYAISSDCDIAPLPGFVQLAAQATDRSVEGTQAQPDTERALARARAYLRDYGRRGDTVAAGSRNARCYELACAIRDLGVSREGTEALLLAEWLPWVDQSGHAFTAGELSGRVASAYRNAQNGESAWAVGSPAETFAALLPALPEPAKKRSRFALQTEDEMDQEQPVTWLIPDLIQDQSTVVMIGKTGSYKSFIALDLALSVATGHDYGGRSVSNPGPVVYAALEGANGIKTKRRRAWRTLHGVEGSISNFYFTRAPMIMDEGQVQEFGDEIAKMPIKPRLIIVDTLAKAAAGLNLNNPGECTRVSNWADSMVAAFGCSVLMIGHVGKDESRGLAGSLQLKSNFDTELEIRAVAKGQKKAVELWITKQKDSDEPEHPVTFELQAVGPSLVPVPTTPARHAELIRKEDPIQPAKVGKILAALGEITTSVLAGELVPALPNETAEERQDAVVRMERLLAKEAKSRLQGYAYGAGKGLKWRLPE